MLSIKRWVSFFAVITLLFVISMESVDANDHKRYIIGFNDEVNEEIVEKYKERIETTFHTIPAVVAELSQKEVKQLREKEYISYVEEDQPFHVNGQVVDWGVKKIGAEPIWKNGLTGKGVKIAILDTGVDIGHPDLKIKEGKSFVNYTDSYKDDNGHGTHVAGVIAAQNNEIGVIGVAHEATVYVAKVLDEKGDGFTSDVVKAIDWSLEKEVDMINLSMSGHRQSTALEESLKKAYESGALIIAAAGNFGNEDGSGNTVDYPALYDSVIAVAAIDEQSKRAPFSATGPEVEVAAPGVDIYSTFLQHDYAYISGTSMATPHVTGHLALLRQAYPQASNVELREMLHKQTVDIGSSGRDPKYGYGRIELPADLHAETPRPFPPTDLIVKKLGWEDDKAQVEISWEPAKEGEEAVAYELYRNDKKITKLETTTFVDVINEGKYTYTVKALNKENKASNKAKPVSFTIKKDEAPVLIDSFLDLEGDEWYAYSIYELVQQGIIKGYPDGTVKPSETITRAEAAVMMSRSLKIEPEPYEQSFIDVRAQSYAADYIQAMVNQDIFRGYGNQMFRPHESIERGELAAILNRSFEIIPEENIYFRDVPSDYFAYEDIAQIAGAKITQGKSNGLFEPKASVTRAEFAVFLARALDYTKQPEIIAES